MENTGRYNWPIYDELGTFKGTVYVIPPLHLKKSMGLVRGKTDKIDAIRIALFIEKNFQLLPVWQPLSSAIKQLKVLLAERNIRIKQKKQTQTKQSDYRLLKDTELAKSLLKLNQQLADALTEQITVLEQKIATLIKSDIQLNKQAQLMRTVPGVGKVLCWALLASTEGFKKINAPRKLACYSGVVPFEHQSGTSVRGKTRVSQYADKKLKSLLHLAAMSAIRLKNELKTYYQRKVAEGKSKMSVLNAVRNKIIHRVFAVIRNEKPYLEHLFLS